MRLRDLTIDPPLILAPMAGLTDSPFRRMVREAGGCGLVTMEFISSEAVTRSVLQERAKLLFHPDERPLSIQLYGSNPARMAETARMVEAQGADACDLNMGCPARKILKGTAGCALMDDLELARSIVRAVRAAVAIPLTVKFRLGMDSNRTSFLAVGRMCQEEGADGVVLHARTARQQYRGEADWSRIAELKAELAIPVVGNGDVTRPEDAVRLFEETGCDAVMIGRAALVNPWIFSQAAALLEGRACRDIGIDERVSFVRRHFQLICERFDRAERLHKLRLFTARYTHGLAGGRHLRRRLSELHSSETLLETVEVFFAELTEVGSDRPQSSG